MKRGPSGYLLPISTLGETCRAFVPKPLPPDPPLVLDDRLQVLVQQAATSLGRLDGISSLLPEPHLFLYSYIRKEAVLSSQIEGTQSSLSDLLLFEVDGITGAPVDDVREVSNYVAALERGVTLLKEGLPISLRLIREIHGVLLRYGRGADKEPGEFRRSQNWLGGTRPGNATHVPPPPDTLLESLGALEKFLHDQPVATPVLIKAALAHVQFETIHPFLDGNGRIGRLLIAALFEHWGLLAEPLMYLSGYLKKHQAEYYRRLSNIRTEGDWESWVTFFLEGVCVAAADAEHSIIEVASLVAADRKRLLQSPKAGPASYRLFEMLPMMPRFTIERVRQQLNTSFPTATAAVKALEDLGIVTEMTGQKKNRSYSYQAYVELLSQ